MSSPLSNISHANRLLTQLEENLTKNDQPKAIRITKEIRKFLEQQAKESTSIPDDFKARFSILSHIVNVNSLILNINLQADDAQVKNITDTFLHAQDHLKKAQEELSMNVDKLSVKTKEYFKKYFRREWVKNLALETVSKLNHSLQPKLIQLAGQISDQYGDLFKTINPISVNPFQETREAEAETKQRRTRSQIRGSEAFTKHDDEELLGRNIDKHEAKLNLLYAKMSALERGSNTDPSRKEIKNLSTQINNTLRKMQDDAEKLFQIQEDRRNPQSSTSTVQENNQAPPPPPSKTRHTRAATTTSSTFSSIKGLFKKK